MKYILDINKTTEFNNKADHCVGTGRMDLALHKEYIEQLKVTQEEIGFSYIRGHGLFSKYMGIYREGMFDRAGQEEYCFTYLDMVMDSYLELNIKPILELGFMPKELASGEESCFFWKGNVTPPKDYNKWARLVQNTLKHLMDRYGKEEIETWPVEVWNEPNLTTFWKNADLQEYLKLYEVTSKAIKEVDEKIQVGGPAICGVDDERWLKEFLTFVNDKNLPLDFVSRHHYTSYSPKVDGHYAYIDLHEPEDAFGWLERSRDIVDSYDKFKGMEIFITEFNTSYVPNAPIHDTVLNAAYVAHMLSRLGDKHASYSYWTFGDVFEEFGVPFTPFHGGFGLVANGCIEKPTFWTFAFYKRLKGECIHKSEDSVIVKADDGSIRGIIWNLDKRLEKKNLNVSYDIANMTELEYFVLEKYVNENTGNPLKMWHEMGEPSSLSKSEKEILKQAAKPGISSKNILSQNGVITLEYELLPNEVRYFEIKSIARKSDSGYDYDRVMKHVTADNEE